MKYLITIWICLLISINTIAESVSFKVLSKIPLINMEEIEKEKSVSNEIITIDLENGKINYLHKTFYLITAKSSKEEAGVYYNLVYLNKIKTKNYVTILFPNNTDDRIIIIISDEYGNGWFNYCEII